MKTSPINLFTLTKEKMKLWRDYNNLPEYVDASYLGYTGEKAYNSVVRAKFPDITDEVKNYEEEILQHLHFVRQKPFGYFRALYMMLKNFSTGESWDSKFNWQFPGRDKSNNVQYAKYKYELLSANDLSNQIYAHVCSYMGIPKSLSKLMARLDACGVIEVFTKGKLPRRSLLAFSDTESDQLAIEKGYQNYNRNDYRIR